MKSALAVLGMLLSIQYACGFGNNWGTSSAFNTPSTDPDLDVKMYFNQECEDKLNEQISEELIASHIYLSMAHYFSRSDVALYGFHKFFKEASEEERQHGQILMDYMNKRGGTISMTPTLDFPHGDKLTSGDWISALNAMKTAMKLEHHVNRKLVKSVHACAVKHDDAHLQDFIEGTFLTEQVDSIKQLGDYIAKMTRLGDTIGLHMFDQDLLK
ncbi:soma ferritin-like [Lineus longissimus]|uniref:soma ferritin-like n=1 Tax=Lineus longissimus TaxID=88925 RepID=UPI002B4DFDB3